MCVVLRYEPLAMGVRIRANLVSRRFHRLRARQSTNQFATSAQSSGPLESPERKPEPLHVFVLNWTYNRDVAVSKR
jgi:hypothetical protein